MGTTAKGVANGLATLGSGGKLTTAQVPAALAGISAQGTAVADLGALTSAAPSALTAVAATGGDAPTEAEYNALLTDVTALRATLAAVVVDAASLRTKLNAALGSLRTAGVIAT